MAFVESTRLLLKNGWQKPIEALNENEALMSDGKSVAVVKGVSSSEHDGKIVTVECGMLKVLCTPDQKFVAPDGSFVSASDLEPGSVLVSSGGQTVANVVRTDDVIEKVCTVVLVGGVGGVFAGGLLAKV